MIDPDDLSNEFRAFLEDKFVGVKCDYCCEGIWDPHGASFVHDGFPASEILKARLVAWQAVHDGWFYLDIEAEDRGEVLDLDWEEFSRTGYEIAVDIKRELPDWTVFYFDLQRFRTRRNHNGFEAPPWWYEITSAMV